MSRPEEAPQRSRGTQRRLHESDASREGMLVAGGSRVGKASVVPPLIFDPQFLPTAFLLKR
jgi:hypothetical protein